MKLKLSILAAAAALAFAGAASAAYQKADTGDSLVLFSAWDATTGKSYTLGLNKFLDDFGNSVSAAAQSIDLNADSNFTALFGSAVPANLQWSVLAADSTTGLPGADGLYRVAFTSPSASAPTVTQPSVSAAAANMDSFVQLVNNACGGGLGLSTGSCTSSSAADLWNINNNNPGAAGLVWGATVGAKLPNVAQTGAGTLNFYFTSFTSTSGRGNATVTALGNQEPFQWILGTDGKLTWNPTPVPEPSTYGMLAAGLLVLGAIARRRLS